MNNLTIIGRITKDLELKNVGSKNTAMLQFNVAVNRNYKDADGNYPTDFFRCTAFGNQAETINKYFKKGSMIAVSGAIQNDKYDGRDGEKHDSWQVHVEKFDFCGSNNKSNEKPEPRMTPIAQDDGMPF